MRMSEESLWSQVMEKGRKTEKGVTHQLTPDEVNKVMRKFNGSPFQVQVERDLRVARYKLYDAVGMWLQSERYVDERTYRAIEGIARSYLDESLVPGYLGRLRARNQRSDII